MWHLRKSNGMPFLTEDVRNANLLLFPFFFERFLNARLHFDVLIGIRSVNGVYIAFAIGQIGAAGFGCLLDDGLILELAFRTEVIGEHVLSQVFQEVLLEKHLVELSHRVAEQLNAARCTIFSN